ncbi:MAG: hypothetical protein JKY91_01850, partial [Emcibacter sp.]|nr:hypothetical protein [Emcibacter sp.]
RTEISLPFDARIGTVSVEKGEYVAVSNLLFEALGIQAVEINAELPVSQFSPLITELGKGTLNLQKPEDLTKALSKMQIGAYVSLVDDPRKSAKWTGKLLRIGESIDPIRNTLNLVVAVNNPYEGIIPGKRPPLLKGMYVAVEFYTPPHEMMVLPRKALHQGRVYVATVDNKLEIRPVRILHKQGQLVVIDSGIREGEKIIITDVIPVIEGLPLSPVVALDAEAQLAIDALGKNMSEGARNTGENIEEYAEGYTQVNTQGNTGENGE